MKITDARWETPQEKQKRESFIKFDKKKESIEWCSENYQKLIKWHEEFSHTYPEKLREREKMLRDDRALQVAENNAVFEEIKSGAVVHYCVCGGKLRYITNYNFCGCENYKNKATYHRTVNLQEFDADIPINITISKLYLTEFKKKYKIPHIMTSIIHKTLVAHSVELLCEIDPESFNTGRNSSVNSRDEENLILPILKSKFTEVYHQQGIMVYDGIRWKCRIPDYICINDESIIVFDAKKALSNIDTKQLAEYHEAVAIIAQKSGKEQVVKSYFIIFNQENNTNEVLVNHKCFNITMLRSL